MKTMMIAAALLLNLVSCRTIGTKVSDSTESEIKINKDMTMSFGALAQANLPDAYKSLMEGATALNSDTRPDQGKTLRYKLDEARDMLDIFAPVLPGTEKNDFFSELRDNLDVGYETVGLFKDLFDIQGVSSPDEAEYDAAKVKSRLDPVLKWKTSFMEPTFQEKAKGFMKSITAKNALDRKKKDLSKFYWRNIDELPNYNTSAAESLASLITGLLKEARSEEDVLLKLKDLDKVEAEETFHNFRKRIRTVVEVIEYFPDFFVFDGIQKAKIKNFGELVKRYGALHDVMISLNEAKDDNDKKAVKDLSAEINKTWADIQEWQKKNMKLKL